MRENLRSHTELKVYQAAAAARREIFRLSQQFPPDERYGLIQQIRNSSRSVAASIAEAWRRRRYKPNWISKLVDAESEAAETQTWLETAMECRYVTDEEGNGLVTAYEKILGQLVLMAVHADKWVTPYK